MENKINAKLYKQIVESVPVLCVDIILEHSGRYVLIKRKNNPLKGFYWVIGGRVLKGESIWEAAMRKVREETNSVVNHLELVGIYEDSYSESEWGTPTHTTSIVFYAKTDTLGIVLDEQSSDWVLEQQLPHRFRSKLYEF